MSNHQIHSDSTYKDLDETEELIYMLIHELSGPLRSIEGFSDILKRNEDVYDEKSKKHLDFISQSADQCKNIVNTLRQYSGLRPKKIKLEHVDCNLLVDEIVHELTTRLDIQDIKFEKVNLPTLVADKHHMYLLFQSILHNAMIYKDDSRSLELEIQMNEVDSHYHFTVSDNGKGIQENVIDTVFQPYRRAAKHSFQGVGMGLTIAKKIVDIHGGSIKIDSVFAQSTCVEFYLPKA